MRVEGQALEDEQFASLTVCGFFCGLTLVLVVLVLVLLLKERVGQHERHRRRRWGTLLYVMTVFAFDGLFVGSFTANLFAWFFRDVIQNANVLPVYFVSIEGHTIASSVFALAHFSFIGIDVLAEAFLVRSVYKHYLLTDKETQPGRRYWFGAATAALIGATVLATVLGVIAASAAFTTGDPVPKVPALHMAIAYITLSAFVYALSSVVLAFALHPPSATKSLTDSYGVSSMGSTYSDRTVEKPPRRNRRETSQIDFQPVVQQSPIARADGVLLLVQCAVLPVIGSIALLLMLGYAHVDGGNVGHVGGLNIIFAAQAHAMATAPLGMILVQARLNELQQAAACCTNKFGLGHSAAHRSFSRPPLSLETGSVFEMKERAPRRLAGMSIDIATQAASRFPELTARMGTRSDSIAPL